MRRLLYHPATMIVFTLVAIVFYLSLDKTAQKSSQAQTQLASLEKEISILTSDVFTAQEELETSQTPQIKEKIIRDELLMQLPGEYVVQFSDDFLVEEEKETESEPDLSPWEEWRGLVL